MSEAFKTRYGPWAVITGASSGIGREIALQVAARGLNVALAARSKAVLDSLAAQIERTCKVQALPWAGDLAMGGGVDQLLEKTAGLETGLLVNSAGFGSGGPFLKCPRETAAEMVDLNCRALVQLTHAFAGRFARQRRGGIILLSSIVGFQGTPYAANYAATKAYVQSLGEALAEELRGDGVDVLTSAPGPTESGFGSRAGMRLTNAEPAARVAADILAALGRKSVCVPGARAKLLFAGLSTAPRPLRVKIMKSVMRSMTQGYR